MDLPPGFVAIGVHTGRLAVLEMMLSRYQGMVYATTAKIVGDPYVLRARQEADEMLQWIKGTNEMIKEAVAGPQQPPIEQVPNEPLVKLTDG